MSRERCPDSALLAAIHDGKASEADLDTWAAHIEQCEQCVTLLESLEQGKQAYQHKGASAARSVSSIWDRLATLGILESGQLADLQAQAQASGTHSDQAVALWLTRQGTLTHFQAAALLAGSGADLVLGDYVLIDQIGAGGMGQVFKALHRRMDRIVALKIVSPAIVQTPESVRRFQREVRAAAKVLHPHIVTAFDAGEVDGQHFLVMEYVDGRDLASLLRERGRFAIEEALPWIMQAAEGLAYAHEHGLVHRDIKPGNLMLSSQGTVKVLDMGLARLDSTRAAEELTHSGQVMGTVDYMAPEQAINPRDADARSDVYSLGCTLYRLVTGKTPYAGETAVERLVAHRESPIPPLRTVCPNVSPELETVFRRMVAKQPQERFQTMREVALALRRIPVTASRADAVKGRARRRRQMLIGAAGATALLVACIAGGWRWLWPQNTSRNIAAAEAQPLVKAPPQGASPGLRPAQLRALQRGPLSIDREVAQWVLDRGGTVGFTDNGVSHIAHQTAALPKHEFKVQGIGLQFCRGMRRVELQRLTRLQELGHLDLGGSDVTDDDLRGVLSQMASLNDFSADFTSIHDQTLKEVQQLPHLRALGMSGTNVSQEALLEWKVSPQLEYLGFGHLPYSEPLQEWLEHRRSLTNMVCHASWVRRDVIDRLLARSTVKQFGIYGDCDLESLTLLEEYPRFQAVFLVRNQALSRKHLQVLLKSPQFKTVGLIFSPLQSGWFELPVGQRGPRFMEVTACPVDDGLFAHLQAYRDLDSIWLRHTDVTKAGVASFQAERPQLHIMHNERPYAGMAGEQPASRLPDREVAQWVLSKGGMVVYKHAGTAGIAYEMTHLPGDEFELTGIDLQECDGLRGAELERLRQIKSLSNLSLDASDVRDEDLLGLLETLPNLAHLTLGFTEIGDSILRELKRLPKLEAVDLSGTDVTERGCLQATLPPGLLFLGIGHLPQSRPLQDWVLQQRSLHHLVCHESWLCKEILDRLDSQSKITDLRIYGNSDAQHLKLLDDYGNINTVFLIANSGISREHLQTLLANPNLTAIGCVESPVRSGWFAAAEGQRRLSQLEIRQCPVDDAIFQHLAGYRNLTGVWLNFTNATLGGVTSFVQDHPQTAVNLNGKPYSRP